VKQVSFPLVKLVISTIIQATMSIEIEREIIEKAEEVVRKEEVWYVQMLTRIWRRETNMKEKNNRHKVVLAEIDRQMPGDFPNDDDEEPMAAFLAKRAQRTKRR